MYQPGGVPSAQIDRFAAARLPAAELWPVMDYSVLPGLAQYPAYLNAAEALLDANIAAGRGDAPCLHFNHAVFSYSRLRDMVDRIAHVLVKDLGLVSGNRVLLRAPNNPMLVACWLAVLKAGGIAVTTMPMLRAKELSQIIEKAAVTHALCDSRIGAELQTAADGSGSLTQLSFFTATGDGSDQGADLDARMRAYDPSFPTVKTAADDMALIAFTSGTTGKPKGTMHFHRDVLAICDCFPPLVFDIKASDIFCGSPPLAFTFGLGALVLFPMRHGASSVLLEQFSPETLLQTVQDYRATAIYTAPTGYRTMANLVGKFDLSSLHKSVSAGEHLPRPTFEMWQEATGVRIIDGLGSTEMLHIFVSETEANMRAGATGRQIPGYQACILGPDGEPMPDGTIGRLAVRGPTGCRYLDDLERQQAYVQHGWNITGDIFMRDEEGYFRYQARSDDMIVSAGYNIAGPEVETVLLAHPKVRECAVIGWPDEHRGQIVKAFVVLHKEADGHPDTVKLLQDFVKAEIAPYKYPRAIEFVPALPRTETGKLQRFRLRPGAATPSPSASPGDQTS